MPKITELSGFGLNLANEELPVVENGQQVFDGHGQPKTAMGKRLTFVDPNTGEAFFIRIPADGVREIVKFLTGGIEVARPEVLQ